MKIKVKQLKGGDPLEVDIDPNEKVSSIKSQVAVLRPDVPPETQKLIHAGVVLQDDKQIKDTPLKEGDFIVLMVTKAKADVVMTAAASAESADPPEPDAPVAPTPATPAPAPAAQAATASPEVQTEAVQTLCAMGFPEDQVKACLRAAFGNPDRAVEYLTGGIPANLQQALNAPPQAPSPAPAAPASAPAAGPGPGMPSSGMPLPGVPLPNRSPSMVPPGTAAPAATGPLAKLRNHPLVNQIRNAVQQHPEHLSRVLCELSKHDPSLVTEIMENQAEFVKILSEPGVPAKWDPVRAMLEAMQAQAGAGGAAPAPAPGASPAPAPAAAPQMPQLSQQDREAIDRLASLGFDKAEALQAYLSCEKNEEVAANMLCAQRWG